MFFLYSEYVYELFMGSDVEIVKYEIEIEQQTYVDSIGSHRHFDLKSNAP